MAIIYSYPTVTPTRTDLILGTDVSVKGKPTKNFTVQSIIDLVTVATGDLQTVLDLGFVAVGKDIDLTNNTFKGAGFQTQDNQTPANVLVNITGQVGTGFTDFTSTRITGTLQTPAQTNITSLGTLTSLKVGTATPAVTSIETTFTNPGTDLALATTKAIVDYIATTPNPETLFQTLQAGNKAYNTALAGKPGFDIDMGVTGTTNGNILFGNNKYIRMGDFGVTYPLELYYGTDFNSTGNPYVAMLQNKAGGISGVVALTLRSNVLDLSSVGQTGVLPEKYLTATKNNGVLLYFNNDKTFETISGGATVTGNLNVTSLATTGNIDNNGYYQDSSNSKGTDGQLLSSSGTGTTTTWVTNPNPTPYSWKIEADSGTGSPYTVANGDQVHFVGVGNVNTTWDDTNKELEISLAGTSVSGGGAADRATYWTGTQTIGSSDKYLFNNATTKLTLVDTGTGDKGIVWANNFTTDGSSTPISATAPKWNGSSMTNMTSITSTLFVGDLTGNASTATQLFTAGTITTSGDVSLTGGPYNYTQGGNMALATTIADSVIMGKVLTGYTAGTAGAIADTDTILDAFKKLQASITATTGLSYEGAWTPGTDATAGGTPDLRLVGAKVNGAFYICDADGTGTPNGDGTTPNSWKSGDWVIYVANGSATDEWQKLDQSNEVLGSGSPNQYTMWSGTNTIGTGVISQDTAATKTVTIGNSANLTVEGNTILGDANTDTTTFKGPGTFEQTARLKTGLALGAATDGTEYGTAGYALTSGGASGNANTWTALEVGTVTSVALTETGDALTITGSPITSSGTINIAGAGAADQYINGQLNLVDFPVLDNYQYWTLSDGTNTTNITTTGTATFAAGDGIINTEGSGILTTQLRYDDSDNAGTLKNFVEAATTGTPTADDLLLFGDQAGGSAISKVNKATISSIVALGDQNLTQVLNKGNTSGTNDIVMADDQKVTFGTVPDLQIYHDTAGGNSHIQTTSGSAGDLLIQSQGTGHDLYLRATDDIYIQPQGSENGIKVIGDGAVELYHNSLEKLATTSTGISVTGGLTATGGGSFGFDLDMNSNRVKKISELNFGSNAYITSPSATLVRFNSTSVDIEDGDLTVSGDLTVGGNIIHGTGGGTFNGDQAITSGASALAFTLTRAATGTLIFDVWLTAETSSAASVAKKYTVAHSFNSTPVYNKIIDTGPDNTNDFTVVFANSNTGATGTSVTCSIQSVTLAAQNIGYTVQVGHDSTRALTFTAAS